MRNFFKLIIDITSAEDAEMLVAELAEINFYAFEQDENHLTGYINEGDFNANQLRSVLLAGRFFKQEIIEDKNWNEEWETQFQPIMVNNFAAIRASFHPPSKDVLHDLVITPKMSFGTGHHATTFLMVAQMENIDFKNKTVLDFGSGTGILAILAEKLGATSVLAIDNDDWSINNALENISANGCKNINLRKTDNIKGISTVNIILANINYNVLAENVISLSGLLQKNSLLVISGFLKKDEPGMLAIFVKNLFRLKERNERDNWVIMMLEKC